MIEIPLTNFPRQIFSINIFGNIYQMDVKLNSRWGVWTLSISQAGVDLILDLPLLGGADLLEKYNLPLTNIFVVNVDNIALDPSKTNLGEASKVIVLEEAELEDLNGSPI
jgi:hypothetical protein